MIVRTFGVSYKTRMVFAIARRSCVITVLSRACQLRFTLDPPTSCNTIISLCIQCCLPRQCTSLRHLVSKSLDRVKAILFRKTAFAIAEVRAVRRSATMPESRSTESLVWIDCEMTGLNPDKDTIMSLACFVTDYELNLLDAHGYEAVIHHTQEQLDEMGAWCRDHHGRSGLTQACLTSTLTAESAAEGLLAYVMSQIPQRKRALLAGNTVHADRMFLLKQPWNGTVEHLHHRIFDVSSIKEAARRWSPEALIRSSPQKMGKHEAKADILESIAEARFYMQKIFQKD